MMQARSVAARFRLALRRAGRAGRSMRMRLLLFLMALAMSMLLALAVVLAATGVLPMSGSEAQSGVRKAVEDTARAIEKDFGDTCVQAVLLSRSLSKGIAIQLHEQGLAPKDLASRPDVLEKLMGNELNRLLLALEKTRCSGVFVVLDATVNPSLPGADTSRAGLYIRNTEPSVADGDFKLYLRGFPVIARQNALSLQSKWDMEFDVAGRDFYNLPMAAARDSALPLSRLYLWTDQGAIASEEENVVLCSVPLLDDDGTPFGVCGFEVSAMYFRLNYAPSVEHLPHSVSLLGAVAQEGLSAERALTAGSAAPTVLSLKKGPLRCEGTGPALSVYRQAEGETFLGIHRSVHIYPTDSPFADRPLALAVLVPKQDVDAARRADSLRLTGILALLTLMGIALSVFISRRYLQPIMSGLSALKQPDGGGQRTNIQEIDEIMETIAAMRSRQARATDNLFEDFIGRLVSLTPTERIVFKLCAQERTNQEILADLSISLSTLKTHYQHIYAKLDVSSRDELMLYIQLLKKSGRLESVRSQL